VEASYTRQKAGILADAKEQVVRLPITHKSFGKIGNPSVARLTDDIF
jgi:hypothetical protein